MGSANQRFIKPPLRLIDPDHRKWDEWLLIELKYEVVPYKSVSS